MPAKKIKDLEIEIEDAELQLLDAKDALRRSRSLSKPDPFAQMSQSEEAPRAELEKRVELLQGKLTRLKDELKALTETEPSATGNRFGPGKLKAEIERLSKRDGFKSGQTVSGKTRKKWLKEIADGGKVTSDAVIRAILSELTITKERKQKK